MRLYRDHKPMSEGRARLLIIVAAPALCLVDAALIHMFAGNTPTGANWVKALLGLSAMSTLYAAAIFAAAHLKRDIKP